MGFDAKELLVGAAIGGPVGLLLDKIVQLMEKAGEFHPTLDRVKLTVEALERLIPEIEEVNKKLSDNAEVVQKLKETLEEGVKLIGGLLEVTDWSCLKPHYTDQLVVFDQSLNRQLQLLDVCGVIDVKKGLVMAAETSKNVTKYLVVAEETRQDVKETRQDVEAVKKGLAGLDAKLSHFIKEVDGVKWTREHFIKEVDGMKWIPEQWGLGDKVESFSEAAILGNSIKDLAASTQELITNKMLCATFGENFDSLSYRTQKISELIKTKRTENKEMSYFLTEELKNHWVKIEEGVKAVHSSGEIDKTCWTEELKAECKNKFLALEKSLEKLNDCLSAPPI